MKELGLAHMLAEKRREKGVTQEKLAAYLGVSKASVSKWETGQSCPDILLLPQIAAYFDISVDALLDYKPQMTREEIRRLYAQLSEKFCRGAFEEAWAQCRETVRNYYSCFPLLLQMAGLLLNHSALAGNGKLARQVQEYAAELCVRVKEGSGDVTLLRAANSLEAAASLMLGRPEEATALLKDVNRMPGLGEESIYAAAMQSQGDLSGAKEVLQVCLYRHVTELLSNLSSYLTLVSDEPEGFEEGMRRAEGICSLFRVEELHPYLAAQVAYVGGYGWYQLGEREKTIRYLQEYARLCGLIFPAVLRGDAFFDRIDPWISGLELGASAPRNEKLIRRGLVEAVRENPLFAPLKEDPRFRRLVEHLEQELGDR